MNFSNCSTSLKMKFEQARPLLSLIIAVANFVVTTAAIVYFAGYKLAAMETTQGAQGVEIRSQAAILLRIDSDGGISNKRELEALKMRVDKLDDVQGQLSQIQTDLTWIKRAMEREGGRP